MDPLSAAASVITVVGAARKAAEGLQSVKAIKDAPKELEDLLLEFSQIETILQAYKNLPTNFQEQSSNLATILGIAENKFHELDFLIHYTLTKAGSNVQVDRLQWVRKRFVTERLREQLGQILVRLNTLLNTTSLTTLQEISFTTNEILNEQKRSQSQMLTAMPEFVVAASQMRKTIEESQATQLELIRLLRHVQQANLTGYSKEGNLLLKDDDQPTGQLIKHRSRVGSNYECKLRKVRNPRICQRYCRCNCHENYRISTPSTLRKCIGFGLLQIPGCYSIQRCSITGCKQSASSILRLDYILPRWFALRMLSIWYDFAPLNGPELLLRVPVVLPWPKVLKGDYVRYMRARNEHIDHWLNTPNHIDEAGCTLFFWAIIYGRYDTINHLLDMGIDLHQRPLCGWRSSYALLWQDLASKSDRFRGTQEAETASKVDWDEYIEAGGLTELHLIVSGIRSRDLERHIRTHPEELEKGDTMGHGPLWYASHFGTLADVRTILKYGALLNEDTFQFSEFISRFGSKAFDFIDEHPAPETLRCLFKQGWPREWFLDLHAKHMDISEILAVDKLFLEHGFDVNHQDNEQNETLLMAMLQKPCLLGRVKQLLDHGADLALTNVYGETALHRCIDHYRDGDIDLKLLNMLIEHGARLDYRLWNGTTILHALILRSVRLEPIKIIFDSDISSLLLDAKDDSGYTAFDLLILRARLLRQHVSDCLVSLEASHHVDYEMVVQFQVQFQGKRMWIAREPDTERKVISALEALLHKVQEVQGIRPPEAQYPSIESVLDQEDMDAEASKLEGLPGSWPECVFSYRALGCKSILQGVGWSMPVDGAVFVN